MSDLVEMIVGNWSFWKWIFIAMTFHYFGTGAFGFTKSIYLLIKFFRKEED